MKIEEIVSNLVSFKTSHDKPQEIDNCLSYCKNFFKEKIDNGTIFSKKYLNKGIPSLVLSNATNTDFDIILLGHIDTVEGSDELFEPKIKDGKIYGRGTMDMKAFVGTNIVTFDIITDNPTNIKIALIIVSDEELGGEFGANYLVNKIGYKAKVVLVPDDGEKINQIVSHSKNILSIRFTAKGVEAHGCRPWDGDNAIEKNIKTYQNLKKQFPITDGLHEEQWINSINLGKISGGTASNEVPGNSEMEINIRWTAEMTREEMLLKIDNSLEDNVTYEILMDAEGVFINFDNKYIKKYITTMESYLNKKVTYLKSGGGTDGRFFHYKDMTVIMHQGTGGEPQGENEYVEIKSLYELVEIQTKFIEKLKS